jgi:hypothetical protein
MHASRRLALSAVGCLLAGTGTVLVVDQLASAATTGFGFGSPGFVNSAAPSDIDQGLFANVDFAGEPSVGVDWNTGAALYQASNSTYKVQFDNAVTPPAVSWSDVSAPEAQFNLDPILATNSTTGTTAAGGDDGVCGIMAITHDDGSSWTPTLPCPIAPDHPTVGFGPFTNPAPADAVGTEAGYFCQQPILTAAPDECSYTHNGGLAWTPSVPDPAGTCHGLFGHVKISPDGTAYIPDATCTDPATGKSVVGGLITTDDGQSLSGYVIPGAASPPDGFDPSVGVDTGNGVYESWSAQQANGDYHPVITWSGDKGKTWAPPFDLANTVSPGITAATFESVVAGDPGRAAVAYLATSDPLNGHDPFASGFVGHWYLYVSATFDGGATWQTTQATADPVQIGEIDAGGTTTGGQRNLLDFMDASVTKDGRVVVAYADGCLNDPTGTTYGAPKSCTSVDQSTDSWATVAYQSDGQGMFSAYDVAPPLAAPAAPTVNASVDTSAGATKLAWDAPADGGSPITGYTVYRGTSSGGETKDATVSGTSFTDSAVTVGTTYYYRVVASNAVGDSDPSNEVTATPTTVPRAPTLAATAGKGQVSLSWSKPADGGAAITGYNIYRGTSSGTETLIQTISSGTSYVDNNVAGGTQYFYEVAAVNRNGTGIRSNEATATPKKGGR